MKRSIKDYLLITAKGMGMGAADVVPGVSGGTIAFITGIYEELINSLKSIEPNTIKMLFKEGIPATWKTVNGNFLFALFIGIGISVVSLSKVIKYLLAEHPILVWSFFFGLIVASAYVVSKSITKWNLKSIGGVVLGSAIAYYITIAAPTQTPTELWFIFLCGMLAICAMILPGISGAFILLLLGKYEYIVGALSELNLVVIATFMAGCVLGLVSFSHVLSYMFKKFHNMTIAILTGFMIGSLNKVWPWKETLTTRIDSHGEIVPVTQMSVLPTQYTESEPLILGGLVMVVVGFLLIIAMDRFSPKKEA
jgi:putative membrane protein